MWYTFTSLGVVFSAGELADLSAPTQEKKIHTGIPAEAFNLECPDIDFKASILQEFLFLDEKYIEKLELVETQHSEAIRYFIFTSS